MVLQGRATTICCKLGLGRLRALVSLNDRISISGLVTQTPERTSCLSMDTDTRSEAVLTRTRTCSVDVLHFRQGLLHSISVPRCRLCHSVYCHITPLAICIAFYFLINRLELHKQNISRLYTRPRSKEHFSHLQDDNQTPGLFPLLLQLPCPRPGPSEQLL